MIGLKTLWEKEKMLVTTMFSKGCWLTFSLFPIMFSKGFLFRVDKSPDCVVKMALIFFNPLPDDKILGLTKLKAFTDDKLNVTQNVKGVFHGIENIVGKGENAGNQHFLLPAFSSFPTMFSKGFFLQCIKSHHCVVMG